MRAQIVVIDLLILGGAGAITWGVWQMHGPAGWITGGALAMACGLALARQAARGAQS